ncbi:MAG: hypothetical protein JO211_16050, partial [Acidobacteriaceae bacterium]|nr:hypothetical protein [Acidobacteriaceae bacterium]
MSARITRRAVLAALPAALSAATDPANRKGRPLPSVGEFLRFADPTTENTVVRLTNPTSASLLPAPGNRFISLRERFLICSSDRTGRMEPFRVDLRTGSITLITPTTGLDPRSLWLDERQRTIYLCDGGALKEIALAGKRTRVLADNVTAFAKRGTADFVLVREGRLELLGAAEKAFATDIAPWCLVQPGG